MFGSADVDYLRAQSSNDKKRDAVGTCKLSAGVLEVPPRVHERRLIVALVQTSTLVFPPTRFRPA